MLPLLSLALVGASGIVCALVPPGSSRALTSAASLLHVLSMSFLLIMLPRSKLFHALGFGTLKRVGIPRRTGVLPKDSGVEHALSSEGAGDRRLGLSTLRDLSLRQRVEADACLSCGLCDVACPPARQGKALSPMRLTQAQAALMNTGSESAPLPSSIARASLDCSSCYACETSCPLQIRKVDRVAGLRRHSVLERGETLPEWSAMLRVCDRTGSVLGAVPGARASLLAALGVPVLEPGDRPEYVLWLGCYGAYDPRMKAVVSALSAALSAAGRRVAALRSESCCGDLPRRAGDEGLFHSLMERNQASLAALDGARVMTVCPHCAHVLGREYAAFGIHVDAVHYTQVLADLPPGTSVDCAQAGPGPRVAYHDSCVLARLYGVADEPRAFLRRTRPDAQIVPLDQERMNTVCCGGGGGRVMAEEPRSQRIAATTMRELSRKQVDVLVTSCPYCLTMYTDAAADAGVRVSDLLAFAAEKRLWPATVRQGS